MNKLVQTRCCSAALLISLCCSFAANAQTTTTAPTAAGASTSQPTALLTLDELQKIIPATVFFRGQSSTVQYRNSGGIRFTGGAILFAVKVDTGGYSTSIQERYQDYFVSEVPVQFGEHALPSGAYGVGFVGSDFLVMDLGGHTMFTLPATTNNVLHRPRPLEIVAAPGGAEFRLYSGKQFIEFNRATSR